MTTWDDLSKLAEADGYCKTQEKETLLSKHRIPIQHFEYDYIEQCNDGKELEKILQILKSGEEGYYPHLVEVAEERLAVIKPKSRLLRKMERVVDKKDLENQEINEICKDLQDWVTDISKHNSELEQRKVNTVEYSTNIREYKEAQYKDKEEKTTEKRIKATDYTAWDKYDPDTEILKMDLAEETQKKSVANEQSPKKKNLKSVSFNKFGTEAEAMFISEREREKGNEFFKAGDYQEALECYTNSVSSKPTVNNLNNRAVTYIKLRKYRKALEDCDKVLALDGENLKAHLRKAEAWEGLKGYEEAMECVSFVIRRDPNNCVAQELAARVRKNCSGNAATASTRVKIVEIE